jgi:hypothetical protein
MKTIKITLKCPNGHKKTITEKDDVGAYPMCDVCYMPMFPIKAEGKS